jgi:hypothetical protein
MKWICTRCGSSRVYVDARVAINDRSKLVAYGAEFCERCKAECEIKPQPKEADHGRAHRSRTHRHTP